MLRRNLSLVLLVPMLSITSLGLLAGKARGDEVGTSMAEAAKRFVASLEESQTGRVVFAFNSPERVNWHWIPRPRKGLPVKEMKPAQRALAFGLLNTGLSTKGVIKATTIMSLEEILRVDEHGTGPLRDSELYYVSVFGTPSDTDEWGWRIEGHHLALNYTLKAGKVVSATPFMFGSNPAEVRNGPFKGLRNLVEIEGPANALIASLTPEQSKVTILSPNAPDVTTTPNSAQAAMTTPEGIAADKLDDAQRQNLTKLLQAYALNFPEPVRTELLEQLTTDPMGIHFAWYGSTNPTKPHSFRIQGAAFFLDFNDTQNETNHIHTFFRSYQGDFGLGASR